MAKGEGFGLYQPETIQSEDPAEITAWMGRELNKISQALQQSSARKIDVLHAEPAKPRPGMVVTADGTDWDPGSGEGPYMYIGGTWLPMFTVIPVVAPDPIEYTDLDATLQVRVFQAGDMIERPTTGFSSAWYECDGSNYTVAGEPDLFAALVKTATVTFDNTTDKVAWTAHGRQNGDVFRFTTTGGAPTGLTVGTTYYIINKATNDFQISATEGGSAINFTSNGTGVHTGIHAPHGYNEGAATFSVPDSRRRATVGRGGTPTATLGARTGATGGAETHTLTSTETTAGVMFGATPFGFASGGSVYTAGNPAGGGGAHNNLGPRLVVTKIIKR